MPNIVNCRLQIKGDRQQVLDKIWTSEEFGLDYGAIIPIPLSTFSTHNEKVAWMDENWKQGFNPLNAELMGDGAIIWEAAWTPPIKILTVLSLMFKEHEFIFEFVEEGGFFSPKAYLFKKGEMVDMGVPEEEVKKNVFYRDERYKVNCKACSWTGEAHDLRYSKSTKSYNCPSCYSYLRESTFACCKHCKWIGEDSDLETSWNHDTTNNKFVIKVTCPDCEKAVYAQIHSL